MEVTDSTRTALFCFRYGLRDLKLQISLMIHALLVDTNLVDSKNVQIMTTKQSESKRIPLLKHLWWEEVVVLAHTLTLALSYQTLRSAVLLPRLNHQRFQKQCLLLWILAHTETFLLSYLGRGSALMLSRGFLCDLYSKRKRSFFFHRDTLHQTVTPLSFVPSVR